MTEKLDAQTVLRSIQELRESMRESALQFDKELRDSQLKTDKRLAEADEQLAETKALVAQTTANLDRTRKELADIGHSNGGVAEEFFFNALNADKHLGDVLFDDIDKNLRSIRRMENRQRRQDEFDIVLINGDSIGLVEVKYKANKAHVQTLITRKVENFRLLFPDYADFKIYTGIAALSFEPEAEEFAHENGVVVLKQLGETLQEEAEGMRAY